MFGDRRKILRLLRLDRENGRGAGIIAEILAIVSGAHKGEHRWTDKMKTPRQSEAATEKIGGHRRPLRGNNASTESGGYIKSSAWRRRFRWSRAGRGFWGRI